MALASDAPHITLDWDAEAVWVQDRSMYLLLDDQDPTAETLRLQDQSGAELTMERSELEKTHVAVHHGTVFKRRYAPIQAFCPREDIILTLADRGQSTGIGVPAGDAVLRDAEGKIKVMPRHEFNCRYQFVAAAGMFIS